LIKSAVLDWLAVLAASSVVIASLFYAQLTDVYDSTTLLVSVVLPLTLGSAILSFRKKILLFGFLAYFWAVVDDAPVFFDSVLTWPQVTRFHPFLPRLYMNIAIHGLTASFMYLAIREIMGGTRASLGNTIRVVILASLGFVVAYAQNIPLSAVQQLVETSWYQFDLAEKLASIFLFYCASREAMESRRIGQTLENEQRNIRIST
jgi:hypothetical protein